MLFMKPRIGKIFGTMYKENNQTEGGSRFYLILPKASPTLLQLVNPTPAAHRSLVRALVPPPSSGSGCWEGTHSSLPMPALGMAGIMLKKCKIELYI